MVIDDKCNNMNRLKKDADMETKEVFHIFEKSNLIINFTS